jgi:peptidoglycan hydrolase CwlO-like protein
MNKSAKLLLLGVFSLSIFFFSGLFVHAQETPTPTLSGTPTPTTSGTNEKASDLQNKIKELEGKVTDLRSQSQTLSSQISVMNNQIKLTQFRINATQQELTTLNADIAVADTRIDKLEATLDEITNVLMNRIEATYKIGTVEPFQFLLASDDVSDFLSRANYLRIAQANDKKLIYNTVQARNDYENQKEIFEQKKQKIVALKSQLDQYSAQLDDEKAAKQKLLEVTKNDEQKYQSLLAQSRAEFEAIQGIVAGNGSETEYGSVQEGQKIASVISGASCNSGGTHLHFIVSKNGATENPFSYLKGVDSENCSGSSCGSSDGDSFNPSGSWNWPLNGRIKMTQGYGSTWATRYSWVGQIYNFHNGIDIVGESSDVKAVKPGTLYQGSYGGSGGCRLRYVRVKHNDDGLDTFYLHVNYNF